MTTPLEDVYLNTAEVARKLRITVPTVREYIRSRRLEAVKIGRAFLVAHSALERFIVGGGA